MSRDIALEEDEVHKLRLLKQGLMEDLLTGRVRVTTARGSRMSFGPEFITVEKPFLDQLVRMGWKLVTGSLDDPSMTGRETFREVLLKADLRKALERINLRDGAPWLDDSRISQAVSALERIAAPSLMEANQAATDLLLKGMTVEGLPGWDQGRAQTVHYIDWDHPENNTFTVVNQFRVDCPGGQAKKFIVPDLVLFVNGIPLVVVECKSPAYLGADRRGHRPAPAVLQPAASRGSRTTRATSACSTRTSSWSPPATTRPASAPSAPQAVHYLEWKDTARSRWPRCRLSSARTAFEPGEARRRACCGRRICSTSSGTSPLFQQVDGPTIKIVCRYQQFRAVQAAIERLLTGKTREQDGEHDRRGGIVWHTQGSGKSLTMVFLVRKIRSIPALRRFKVVVVTDRKDLAESSFATRRRSPARPLGWRERRSSVKRLLAEKGPGSSSPRSRSTRERDADAGRGRRRTRSSARVSFPVLNEDESILVMVDEAHRSHTSALHGNLLKALPNCARIGFTGTPIIMGAKKRTHDIFGEFIDRYTIKQSEEDGATVPILYEGRTAEARSPTAATSTSSSRTCFSEQVRGGAGGHQARSTRPRGNVLEAPTLIEAKARDMLRHYVEHILPNGFKAQVVAYSRLAAVRYHDALRGSPRRAGRRGRSARARSPRPR